MKSEAIDLAATLNVFNQRVSAVGNALGIVRGCIYGATAILERYGSERPEHIEALASKASENMIIGMKSAGVSFPEMYGSMIYEYINTTLPKEISKPSGSSSTL
jgi:hypothetical protein